MTTTIIADIEKEITYSRATRDYDMFIIIDGQREYIGSAPNHSQAETITNQWAYDYLTDSQTIETAAELLMELPADAFCVTCGNDGDCPDCELPAVDPYAPMGECAICGADAWCTTKIGLLCPVHEPVIDTVYAVEKAERMRDCEPSIAAQPVSIGKLLDQSRSLQTRIKDAWAWASYKGNGVRSRRLQMLLNRAEHRTHRRFIAKQMTI